MQAIADFFSLIFHWITTDLPNKSNLSIIVFKYKPFNFFYCFFYKVEYIQKIHHYVLEKQKKQKVNWSDMNFIYERKNNVIRINLNHSNNFCLYSLEKKGLVYIND